MASKSSKKRQPVSEQHRLCLRENGEPKSGVGRGVGFKFAQAYFPEAKERLRIASGFFYIEGYDKTRDMIGQGVRIQILVGKDDARKGSSDRNLPQSSRVVDAITSEILRELGYTPTELHDAVADLVKRMEAETFGIWDARQTKYSHRFHCKYYISDDVCMWSGSANYTRPGLSTSSEQVTATRDADEIAMFIADYDEEIKAADDLMEQVKLCLKDWLAMISPHDAYLKILHCLFGEPQPEVGEGGHRPNYYQEEVIVRALQQLDEYGGAFLIIATGLGKTIIGSEIARRRSPFLLNDRTVLLAPKVVADGWKRELASRGLHPDIFDSGLLFKQDTNGRTDAVSKLLKRLERCEDSTTLIIDEAHYYRNTLQKDYSLERANKRDKGDRVNQVKKRIAEVVARGTKIVLLTATPYGTNLQNVNSLLHLLPHTAQNKGLLQETGCWETTTLAETAILPVVTMLGLVDVLRIAARLGDKEENGRLFIALADGARRYLPKTIALRHRKYDLFLETEMQQAFADGLFKSKPMPMDTYDPDSNKNISVAADTVRNNAVRSWLSSPREMARFLTEYCAKTDSEVAPETNADTESLFALDVFADPESTESEQPSAKRSKRNLVKSQEERISGLAPIREKIAAMTVADDDKIERLREIIAEHSLQNHKIIVFVDRRATAVYLHEALDGYLPGLPIGCTLAGNDNEKYSLLSSEKRKDIVHRFSPLSNDLESLKPEDGFDLLICTDADGIGLNMQDACVVVNYDLPYTADEVFQRAGRVLRMTADPERTIFLYTLVPNCRDARTDVAGIVTGSLETLTRRHNASTALLAGKVIAGQDEMVSLATVDDLTKFAELVRSPLEAKPDAPKPLQGHIAFLNRNRHRVGAIAEVTLSAKEYDLDEPRMVLIVRFEQKHHLICYNVATQQCENKREDVVLGMICSVNETEDKVLVGANAVEQEAIKAMSAWLAERGTPDEENECLRVCSVYLRPHASRNEALKQMLRNR